MRKVKSIVSRNLAVFVTAASCHLAVLPVLAAEASTGQRDAQPVVARPRTAQELLILRLVERGVLTRADAEDLLKAAEADTADARVQAALAELAAAQAAAAKARADAALALASSNTVSAGGKSEAAAPVAVIVPVPEKSPTVESAAPAVAFVAPAVSVDSVHPTGDGKKPQEAADDADEVRVTYVPEAVKAQLREEIKNEVMQQAKTERWAAPRSVPEWVSRLTFYGDFRLRYENIYNHQQNDVSSETANYINFNALNTGAPFDVSVDSNLVKLPRYNIDQDRSRARLRARLGVVADLGEGFTSGLRMATGENGSPVSQNQTLGASGGNFSKFSLWLDRAYLKFQSSDDVSRALTVNLGRFDNPFLSTSILWADDLAFDGLVASLPFQVHYDSAIVNTLRPYVVAGAFPIFNTDLNFPSNTAGAKYKSNDKWLDAVQIGLDLKLNRDFSAKFAAAYYYFTKTVGKLSTPFTPFSSSDAGDTDARRPSFAQKGNTYMALRAIDDVEGVTVRTDGTAINRWQYFGLATPFRDLVYDVRFDYNHFEPFQISLLGEYITNTGFDKAKILARSPENNLGATAQEFLGGGKAWIVGLRIGDAVLQKRWDWILNINYRNVESDAVIDGFCDSDFGGGGTNVKGLTLAGSLALSKRVAFGARWMSATQVEGVTYKNDILQLDLNAKF